MLALFVAEKHRKTMKFTPVVRLILAGAGALAMTLPGVGQAPAMATAPQALATAPHALGTVKVVAGSTVTLTTATGDVTVTIPDAAKILDVPPGSTSLKTATPGVVADIAIGDKLLVNGSTGDTATALTAQRVVVMKAAAIAQSHAAEEAAWTRGIGGIVKTVNASAGTVTLSSGLKTVSVQTTPATIVRHYADGSVKFEDAVKSSVAAIQPGDQLRVRGAKSEDGTSIQADEIVAGTFRNYSGVITSIDGTAGTVAMKDLTTKKNVTVFVTAGSDVRRIPPQIAMGLAARMHPGAAGAGGSGAGGPGAGGPGAGGPGGPGRAGPGRAGPGGAGPGGAGSGGATGRAGMDLSQMLSRLPTETLGGLKAGDAVMIVATASADGKQTAITLLAGVDAILAAQPAGEAMTLSPWSVGGAAPEGGAQ